MTVKASRENIGKLQYEILIFLDSNEDHDSVITSQQIKFFVINSK